MWLERRLPTLRLGCGMFYSPGLIALDHSPLLSQCRQFAIGLWTDKPKGACGGAVIALSTQGPGKRKCIQMQHASSGELKWQETEQPIRCQFV